MKKILFSVAFTTMTVVATNAQSNQSGVYLSLSDFENNKLSYTGKTTSETNKIHFNEFFEKPFITVNHNNEKTILFKDEIFAYKNKGNIVHTWNFTPYNFVEKGSVWIYSKDVNASQGKGIRKERKYFYSISGNGEILPLTVNNLKRSFPNNRLFHVLLDAQFRSDAELSWYDSFARKLKINYLLETAISGITKN